MTFSAHDASILATALECLAASISVIPVREDGSKQPALNEWKTYQEQRPTTEQVQRWFCNRKGLGIVTGAVSGNLVVLDFDAWDTYLDFLELARATGYGDLVDRVRAGYEERTPKGAHLPWRCEKIAGNTKLAQRSTKDDYGHELCNEHGNPITETLVETRGEGGFTIIAPSNGTVHPSGKPYVLLSGSIATVATVTQEEREELFTLARPFNEVTKAEQKERHHQERESAGARPGDVFNARATWEEILELRGWLKIYARKEVTYWRRPGKERGVSATTNYQGSDLLYVFSTSTPFEPERGYSKFSAYALLNLRLCPSQWTRPRCFANDSSNSSWSVIVPWIASTWRVASAKGTFPRSCAVSAALRWRRLSNWPRRWKSR